LIPLAPTKPSGFEVPLLAFSAVSRPAKFGSVSNWASNDPLVTQRFGALMVRFPPSAPTAFCMRIEPVSVLTSIALPAVRDRESERPASIQ
jgi:hypothetical protein